MSRSIKPVLALAATLAAASAVAGTSFTSTWANPAAEKGNFQGRKVVALVLHPDMSVRLGSEDALARQLKKRGIDGVAAYTVVPKELLEEKNKDQAKAFMEKQGVVGVIALRVVGKDQEITSSPASYWGAPYYSSFWGGGGYWAYGWGGVYDPGYLRSDTIVLVETLIFSLEQDKLLWAAQSRTTNPKDVGKFVEQLTGKVASELKKQGLTTK